MKKPALHRVFALAFMLIILIPITIQAGHALDKHEHTICNAVDVKHIHSLDIDCSFFHYQIQQDVYHFLANYDSILLPTIVETTDNYIAGNYRIYINPRSSRAPPVFIVS